MAGEGEAELETTANADPDADADADPDADADADADAGREAWAGPPPTLRERYVSTAINPSVTTCSYLDPP